MTDIEIIPATTFKSMPWKNGLGNTLEITRYDDQYGQRLRISKAYVVEDGFFSHFSQQHRTLVLLSGEGMTLQHKGQDGESSQQLKKILDIARFSGADQTYATLQNKVPIEDLNIMVRAKDTFAIVTAFRPLQSLTPIQSYSILLNAFYAVNYCVITLSDRVIKKNKIYLQKGSFLSFTTPLSLIDKTMLITEGDGVFIEVLDYDQVQEGSDRSNKS